MSFHLATAYVVMGVLYLFMPLSVWYALRRVRSRTVTEWCLGGTCFGIGLLMLGQRGNWPEWVTFELAATLTIGAQLLRITALRRDLNKPLAGSWSVMLLLVYVVAYVWLRRYDGDVERTSYYLLSLVFLMVYFGWIAVLALALARQGRITSGVWLAIAYAPLSVVMGLQIYRYFSIEGQLYPLASDWSSIAQVLFGNLAAVIGNIAFMGIFIERAIRKQVTLAAEQAKMAEAQRLERHLAQLDRVRGIGMISASMAHELSQPMSSLQLIAEQAKMEIDAGAASPERTRTHLQRILEQSAHVREVVNRIRSFVKNQDPPHSAVSLAQVHQNVMALMAHLIQGDRVEVNWQPQTLPLWVTGDAVQLTQVLLNVYRNAIDATSQQAIKRLDVRAWQAGDWVHLQVSDNGPGFSEQALAHGNEGFFSTKTGGLGLGLLISRQIIQAHGGVMNLTHAPEGGACIQIQLRAHPAAVTPS